MPTVCPMQISKSRWIYDGFVDLIEYYMMIEVIWNELQQTFIIYDLINYIVGCCLSTTNITHKYTPTKFVVDSKTSMRITEKYFG